MNTVNASALDASPAAAQSLHRSLRQALPRGTTIGACHGGADVCKPMPARPIYTATADARSPLGV